MEMWELVKKITDKGYALSVGPHSAGPELMQSFVEIRMADMHAPRRKAVSVALERGLMYDPNQTIENAVSYLLYELEKEKEVGQ